jgi:cytochrome c peroxidase
MKRNSLVIAATLLALIYVASINCGLNEKAQPELALKKYTHLTIDSCINALTTIKTLHTKNRPFSEIKTGFLLSRQYYKKVEAIVEYYFQGITKRINGPVLPDVKTEDGQVWPPHGFQVLEQFVYTDSLTKYNPTFINEIEILETDLKFVQASMVATSILPQHVAELQQHQLIRIATQGIVGFDCPISLAALQEVSAALTGLKDMQYLYFNENSDIINAIAQAQTYLSANNNFDEFDRLNFIGKYLLPISDAVMANNKMLVVADTLVSKPFKGGLRDLLTGKGFNPDYYSSYFDAASNQQKIILGEKLFYDNLLSSNNKLNCASCHKPEKYFTDGKPKAQNFVHGGVLARNTPTVLYASLQGNQFYDVRAITLEDQIDAVMQNTNELNFSDELAAKKLQQKPEYALLFEESFGKKDTISGFKVRNAIAAYIRSLNPFSSRLDEYFLGKPNALNSTEISGFNLFMGKAKCGTCHFLPLFNGNNPPWFSKSETEVIGVPSKTVWKNATIDADSGRYKINSIPELLFAFKTPTIRNIEKTAPYMHNGIYKSLEDIVLFYSKGGGIGVGIDLPNQSLPFDSLKLSLLERNAIVAFMKTLTDKNIKATVN